jgi:serine/threonine-protein kinase
MYPKTIGRYEIIKELGHGGMCTVYVAHDPRSNRDVAIKILPSELTQDPSFRTRFEREAQAVALLEHPAIVPVYDYGEADGQNYLVMRLMTGGSLEDHIRQGPMDIAEAARIIATIAPGLDQAHTQGMVHRDIKPGNILFDQNDQPYLADFGIVKLNEAGATLTGNAIVGTPAYMSPEQCRGDADLDGRSDIYSLGTILFEMLTGKLPYEADSQMGQILKHIKAPIPDILRLRPDLPPDCQKVINRAMSKRKFTRYPTAYELAKALSAVANGVPLPAVEVAPTMSIPLSGDDVLLAVPADGAQLDQKMKRPAILVAPNTSPESTRQKPKLPKSGRLLFILAIFIIGGLAFLVVYPSAFTGRIYLLSLFGNTSSTPFAQIILATQPSLISTPKSVLTSTAEIVPTISRDANETPTAVITDTLDAPGVPNIEPTGQVILPIDASAMVYEQPQDAVSIENFDRMVKLAIDGMGAFLDISLSPDGSLLAVATTTGVYLYDATTLSELHRLPTQYPAVSVAFSPDGNLLAIAEQNNAVLWDLSIPQPLYTLDGRGDCVDHVEFSGNGETLISGGKHTYVWRVNDGFQLRVIADTMASTVGVSYDGQWLAIPIEARDIQIVNALDGSILQLLRAYGVTEVDYYSAGDILVATCGDIIRLWGTEEWNLLGVLDGSHVSFSQDGQTLATILKNGPVNVWRFGMDGTPSVVMQGYEYDKDGAVDIQISSEGTYLAIWYTAQITDDPVADKYQVLIYRIVDGQALPAHSVAATWTSVVLFSPDESKLISLSANNLLQLWEVTNSTAINTVDRLSNGTTSFPYTRDDNDLLGGIHETMSPNGEMFAEVVGENIEVYFAKDKTKIRTIYANLASETDIAFTPDGRTIASISQGDLVRVWNVDDGKQICTVGGTATVPVMPGVSNIFFSLDGNTMGVYQRDGTLSYWNGADCSSIYSFHLYPFLLTPNRSIFVEGDEHFPDVLFFRKVEDGSLLLTLYGPFDQYAFYDKGRFFVTIMWDETLHIWGVLP